MSFIDEQRWTGKLFTRGWSDADGGTIPVIEPATGKLLATVGAATVGDLGRSVAQASQAQAGWAATPHTERAAMLRRAAALFKEHDEEIRTWLMREGGNVRR